MPISFAPGDAIYDVTPLENFFIQNYMTEATGEFVKVYIYGLMYCYRQEEPPGDYADFARDLHMNEETVRAALAYWEKLQLINIVSQKPLALEYVNLIHKFISGTAAPDKGREKEQANREFADHVQHIFTGERVLAPTEFNRVFDWRDILKFEPAAIDLLIRFCVSKKGARVSFNYMDAVAQDLAGREITTAQGVEAWIMEQEAVNSGAARVLARWSLRRAPTVDEMLLFRKWTEEWGFDEAAIMAVAPEITATSNPNFKYLDSILESYYEAGAVTARMVQEEKKRREELRGACTEIARALGMRMSASNSTELENIYSRFTSLGFGDSTFLLAASMLCREGRHTLADFAALLNKWLDDGMVSPEVMQKSKERNARVEAAVQKWLERWGQSRAPAPGEKAAFVRFTEEWAFPADVVDFAAEKAALADHPLAMMGKLLSGWRDRRITDRKAAQEDWEKSRQESGRSDSLETGFAGQRNYSKDQFDGMKSGVFDLKDL